MKSLMLTRFQSLLLSTHFGIEHEVRFRLGLFSTSTGPRESGGKAPVLFAWQRGAWPAIPFLCFFPLGFCIVMAGDLRELLQVVGKKGTKGA